MSIATSTIRQVYRLKGGFFRCAVTVEGAARAEISTRGLAILAALYTCFKLEVCHDAR